MIELYCRDVRPLSPSPGRGGAGKWPAVEPRYCGRGKQQPDPATLLLQQLNSLKKTADQHEVETEGPFNFKRLLRCRIGCNITICTKSAGRPTSCPRPRCGCGAAGCRRPGPAGRTRTPSSQWTRQRSCSSPIGCAYKRKYPIPITNL